MRTEITQHGIMWFTGNERMSCPECRLPTLKSTNVGTEKQPQKKKVEVGEGEEKRTEFVDEMIDVSFVSIICTDCGCRFKVYK